MPVKRSRTVDLPRVIALSSSTSRATVVTTSRSGSAVSRAPPMVTAAQQPMAGGRLVEPEHRLPQALGVGVDDAESDVVGEGTKVGDMVVNPFQLQQHGANNPVFLGHFDAGCFSTALAKARV